MCRSLPPPFTLELSSPSQWLLLACPPPLAELRPLQALVGRETPPAAADGKHELPAPWGTSQRLQGSLPSSCHCWSPLTLHLRSPPGTCPCCLSSWMGPSISSFPSLPGAAALTGIKAKPRPWSTGAHRIWAPGLRCPAPCLCTCHSLCPEHPSPHVCLVPTSGPC